jgi:pyruvate formate lyase activating enzyme
MRVGGLLKFSLIDYPGKMSAVIFTQGCNFRCPYCHNPELVLPECFREPVPEGEVWAFLEKRIGLLEGVVVTGGEPTVQKDLPAFLRKLRKMGYLIKLDSNGSNPDVLKDVLRRHLVDYIAMDLKATIDKYNQLTSLKSCGERVRQSIRLILESDVDYEFRTTLVTPFVSAEDLPSMVSLIPGAKQYRLQRFIPRDNILNKEWLKTNVESFTEDEVVRLQSIWGVGC